MLQTSRTDRRWLLRRRFNRRWLVVLVGTLGELLVLFALVCNSGQAQSPDVTLAPVAGSPGVCQVLSVRPFGDAWIHSIQQGQLVEILSAPGGHGCAISVGLMRFKIISAPERIISVSVLLPANDALGLAIDLLLALIFTVTGMAILLRAPHRAVAHVTFALFYCVALSFCSYSLRNNSWLVFDLFNFIVQMLTRGLAATFVCLFPSISAREGRSRWRLLPYFPLYAGIALAFVSLFMLWASPVVSFAFIVVSFIYNMICMLIVLGIMAWGLRHLGKHEQQFVRMMVISIIFLLLPLAIGLDFMQPVEVVQDSLLRLLPIPLVVLPIACIYSLFRTRLLGATSIFSRQVMRVLLWILLSSVFVFGAIILLRTLLLAGLSQDKLNYIYALLLVCSLFLFPLVWSKVRDVGDQVLYGDFYEYNRSLRELSAALTRLQSFEQISTFMLPRLSTLLNATEAAILLRPGELTGVLLDSGGRETLSGWRIYRHCETHSKYADQIVRTPFSEERLLRVANLALTHLREAVDEPLLLDGVLLLALYHGNRCSGFLCLGPKFNLEPYNKQDRSFLSTLASQLSVLEVNSRYLEQAQTDAQQLAALNHRVMSAQEEERRHLALELHDDALQQAMLVVRELSDAGTMADVAEVMPLARSVVASLRRTCLELRPPLLEELGLVEAFQWLVRQTVERGGNHLPVQIICRGSWSNRPSADVELAFYRVGQEALSNILKYAGASRVMVRLDQRANGQLSLLVIDNGRGLQPRPRRRAENLGLIGMQERMAAIGGQLQIRTSPGRGVIIRATYCQSNADSVQPAYALTSVAASAIGQEAHR